MKFILCDYDYELCISKDEKIVSFDEEQAKIYNSLNEIMEDLEKFDLKGQGWQFFEMEGIFG